MNKSTIKLAPEHSYQSKSSAHHLFRTKKGDIDAVCTSKSRNSNSVASPQLSLSQLKTLFPKYSPLPKGSKLKLVGHPSGQSAQVVVTTTLK